MYADTGKSPLQLNLGQDPQMDLSKLLIWHSWGQIRPYVDAQQLLDEIMMT